MPRLSPLELVQSSRAAADSSAYPDKRFATLRARMALMGGTLQRVEDDRGDELFIVGRWNLHREIRGGLDAVEAWIDRLEGRV